MQVGVVSDYDLLAIDSISGKNSKYLKVVKFLLTTILPSQINVHVGWWEWLWINFFSSDVCAVIDLLLRDWRYHMFYALAFVRETVVFVLVGEEWGQWYFKLCGALGVLVWFGLF